MVGGGLAGSEAAWQLAEAGVGGRAGRDAARRADPGPPQRLARRAGLLELAARRQPGERGRPAQAGDAALGSLIIALRAAGRGAGRRRPGGRPRALRRVGRPTPLSRHPRIVVERREVEELPDGPAVVWPPGRSPRRALHRALERLLGEGALAFYDAIAPIVAADSLDLSAAVPRLALRQGRAATTTSTRPWTGAAVRAFVAALLAAEKRRSSAFELEDVRYFEGCLPIEVMAERGLDTLRFGPMKPVGLDDPRTGRRPYAVVQLRQDDLAAGTGTWSASRPGSPGPSSGASSAPSPGSSRREFVRFGMIHRNTFVDAPAPPRPAAAPAPPPRPFGSPARSPASRATSSRRRPA